MLSFLTSSPQLQVLLSGLLYETNKLQLWNKMCKFTHSDYIYIKLMTFFKTANIYFCFRTGIIPVKILEVKLLRFWCLFRDVQLISRMVSPQCRCNFCLIIWQFFLQAGTMTRFLNELSLWCIVTIVKFLAASIVQVLGVDLVPSPNLVINGIMMIIIFIIS